jgi:hypothetical protein
LNSLPSAEEIHSQFAALNQQVDSLKLSVVFRSDLDQLFTDLRTFCDNSYLKSEDAVKFTNEVKSKIEEFEGKAQQ